MKILIVYNTAIDKSSVSGVQTYFSKVVDHWIETGAQVDLLIGQSAFPVFQQLFPKSQCWSSDSFFDPNRYLGQPWRFFPVYAWRALAPLRNIPPIRYDAVLSCAQFVYEVWPARSLARRDSAALTVKIHHLVSAQRRPTGLIDRIHFLSERISTRWLNREADAILCGTELIARDFNALESQLGLSPSRTFSTGYGLDLEALPLSVDAEKEFDAVLLGRVHEHKGVFDVVPLWQRVLEVKPSARMLVVGEGPHRLELENRVRAAGLAHAVTLTGAVSEAEKCRLLSRCRIGLSLSREEGWGLSVNEFLGIGLPVVAMEVPVFRSVFPDQLDLVPQGDISAASNRVVHWLDHPEEARRRGIEGREFVKRYDHRAVAERELEILREAVRRRRLKGGRVEGMKG